MNPPFSLNTPHINHTLDRCLRSSKQQVESTLNKRHLSYHDLPVLLSPAAQSYLEEMAQRSHSLSIQRFGRTMQLFIPLYLSNECHNTCTYCSFSQSFDYPRHTLSSDEIHQECELLQKKGFKQILLLTGEAPKSVDADYIAKAAQIAKGYFSSVGIEVQPLEQSDYKTMLSHGCDSLTVYQETYHPDAYKRHHLYGKKRRYEYRLQTPERAAKAGMYKINLGILLGLSEWRFDAVALAEHLHFLQTHYWQTHYSVSFPRIKGMIGDYQAAIECNDKDLVQLITAFRLIFPDIGITLSTREPATLRSQLIPLGITTMSAESNTSPGGYSGQDEQSQFDISDHRNLEEIQSELAQKGYHVMHKNWEYCYSDA
ncbi:MAG: 2-iminoacetate synthase ThiH [Actinobacteria bacterium]|nr:2-iminoacetate synthase ThiH [Actinomycetota bacterium]